MKWRLAGIVLAVPLIAACTGQAVPADEVDQQEPAGERRESQQAPDALHASAESGDAQAQFTLGILLLESGREESRAKGTQWLAAAGEQGHALALMTLGTLALERGDEASALTHLQNAAATGDPDANYALGLVHFNGENVVPDAARAADLFKVAADAGHAAAQMRLAAAYWNGEGRARDPEQAFFWFLLAAPENRSAAEFLPSAESALDSAQREAVLKRVAGWKPKNHVPAWSSKRGKGH
ncbi:MAG TPA: tetratricopeptide repeat protein [Dokdonella sp.]|uniref:tetratricopeptide repeat protein n=1 Tax=Dokdonella sp. TaxID=2291710 RepID=UPI0025C5FFD7|nr:tetratricopeptide repeat protein [Dokdonella sp.]MBX3691978.1 sel1 repeat family protein [Dokdonella sp.]HNR91973.1 tetratricopeptide repeat protein [Dokdonella sp.]